MQRPVTDEQIEQAQKWDLLSYLQHYEPDELVKCPGHKYRTKTHHSLVISHGLWNWINGDCGGKTELDYLIKVRGMDFVEAVQTLCDGCGLPPLLLQPPPAKEEKEPFVLAPCITLCDLCRSVFAAARHFSEHHRVVHSRRNPV